MEITFKQNEELNYEAEIKVDGDFNLHIERVSKGPIYLMQRGTSEGEYSNSAVLDNDDDTLDYDFAALVYPKYIKVVSGSEVVSASVNFNEGGGSGSGSSSNDDEALYYKFEEPLNMWNESDSFYKEANIYSRARGGMDASNRFYGTIPSLCLLFGVKYSSKPVIDAFEFKPIQLVKSFNDMSVITYKDYETLCTNLPGLPPATRITAEEYWKYYKE